MGIKHLNWSFEGTSFNRLLKSFNQLEALQSTFCRDFQILFSLHFESTCIHTNTQFNTIYWGAKILLPRASRRMNVKIINAPGQALPVFRAVTLTNGSTWRRLQIKWPNPATFPLNYSVPGQKRKAGHDAAPAADSWLTFHAAQHSLDPHFGSILFQGTVGSQKPLSLFHHITQCCNPIKASHPVGKRAMQSSLCLLPWGTVNTGLPLARRWLQAFTCTGIFTRAITGLILFCGLKIFFSPSCVISAYLLEMAAFLTATQ